MFRIRLMAFDAGIFSFKDFLKDRETYILITNPKNFQFKSPREIMIKQAKYSTHIRLLVFSKKTIRNVNVFIDNVFIGHANHANDSDVPLYLLSWDPNKYKTKIHTLRVEVEVNIEKRKPCL
jgi:hypothetical protein